MWGCNATKNTAHSHTHCVVCVVVAVFLVGGTPFLLKYVHLGLQRYMDMVGMDDGVVDGTDDGTTDGVVDGTEEGTTDGVVDGTEEGTMDGVVDGTEEGTMDGVLDGT